FAARLDTVQKEAWIQLVGQTNDFFGVVIREISGGQNGVFGIRGSVPGVVEQRVGPAGDAGDVDDIVGPGGSLSRPQSGINDLTGGTVNRAKRRSPARLTRQPFHANPRSLIHRVPVPSGIWTAVDQITEQQQPVVVLPLILQLRHPKVRL